MIWLALVAALFCADLAQPADVPHAGSIRGWTILSDSEPDALAVIEASRAYRINSDLPVVARELSEYPVKPPAGQWNWAADADAAMRYYRAIE